MRKILLAIVTITATFAQITVEPHHFRLENLESSFRVENDGKSYFFRKDEYGKYNVNGTAIFVPKYTQYFTYLYKFVNSLDKTLDAFIFSPESSLVALKYKTGCEQQCQNNRRCLETNILSRCQIAQKYSDISQGILQEMTEGRIIYSPRDGIVKLRSSFLNDEKYQNRWIYFYPKGKFDLATYPPNTITYHFEYYLDKEKIDNYVAKNVRREDYPKCDDFFTYLQKMTADTYLRRLKSKKKIEEFSSVEELEEYIEKLRNNNESAYKAFVSLIKSTRNKLEKTINLCLYFNYIKETNNVYRDGLYKKLKIENPLGEKGSIEDFYKYIQEYNIKDYHIKGKVFKYENDWILKNVSDNKYYKIELDKEKTFKFSLLEASQQAFYSNIEPTIENSAYLVDLHDWDNDTERKADWLIAISYRPIQETIDIYDENGNKSKKNITVAYQSIAYKVDDIEDEGVRYISFSAPEKRLIITGDKRALKIETGSYKKPDSQYWELLPFITKTISEDSFANNDQKSSHSSSFLSSSSSSKTSSNKSFATGQDTSSSSSTSSAKTSHLFPSEENSNDKIEEANFVLSESSSQVNESSRSSDENIFSQEDSGDSNGESASEESLNNYSSQWSNASSSNNNDFSQNRDEMVKKKAKEYLLKNRKRIIKGFFIRVEDFDGDPLFSNKAFNWVYISIEGNVYKMNGVTENGNIKWIEIPGVSVEFEGNKDVIFEEKKTKE